MRIGINALFWIPNAMGGTQTYFLNLLRALVCMDPSNNYLVFLNKDGAKDFRLAFPNLQAKVCPIPGRPRSLRVLWENAFLPSYTGRCHIDLLHSLGYLAPFGLSIPSIITVMDMIHYIYPDEIEKSKIITWKALFPASLRRADHVISISESVKREIACFFPWAESKTTPIPLGVDHALFRPLLPGEESFYVNDEARQFILAVGSLLPHKNLETLVRAFAMMHKTQPTLQLAIVGMSTSHAPRLRQLSHDLSVEARVRFLGRIADQELIHLYRRARVFVFPSLYEGFGLPLLEAMACGCPVIASNRSSIPEVSKDAAILVDPEDISQLISALTQVLSSEKVSAELRRRGLERAATFTWESTAARTLAVYRHCYERAK